MKDTRMTLHSMSYERDYVPYGELFADPTIFSSIHMQRTLQKNAK